MSTDYVPSREDRFSFGIWTVGWQGVDVFGSAVRPSFERVPAVFAAALFFRAYPAVLKTKPARTMMMPTTTTISMRVKPSARGLLAQFVRRAPRRTPL